MQVTPRFKTTSNRSRLHCAMLVREERKIRVPLFALHPHIRVDSPRPILQKCYCSLRSPALPMPNACLPTTLQNSRPALPTPSELFKTATIAASLRCEIPPKGRPPPFSHNLRHKVHAFSTTKDELNYRERRTVYTLMRVVLQCSKAIARRLAQIFLQQFVLSTTRAQRQMQHALRPFTLLNDEETEFLLATL